MSSTHKSARLEVVDAVRGLAVLSMIEWHTAEGWLREPERSGSFFWALELVGGLAAPFFFLLAGLSAGLAEKLPTSGQALGASVRRGLSIVVAGYGLRTYAWAIDQAALVDPASAPVVLALAVGLALLWRGLSEPAHRRWLAAGALVFVVGVVFLPASGADVALRLDVLQGIGVALVIVACVLAASSRLPARARPFVPLMLALVVALSAPHVLALRAPPGPIRVWDFVARFDVSPEVSGARFPIVPWLGHALVGAALGRALRGLRPRAHALGLPIESSPMLVAIFSSLVATMAFEAGPVATAVLGHAPWLRGVVRILFYGSTAIALAGLVAWIERPSGLVGRTLTLLGRHSLVIYAVHLEIAYGRPGTLVQHALGWWAWAGLALCLVLSMIALARSIERWEGRNHARSGA